MRIRHLSLVGAMVLALAACGGDGSADGGTPQARGQTIYESNCLICHGAAGIGVAGYGAPLAGNEFVKGSTDAELVEFISRGRAADDPENLSGVTMLPDGGVSPLTDPQRSDVVAYLRTLN